MDGQKKKRMDLSRTFFRSSHDKRSPGHYVLKNSLGNRKWSLKSSQVPLSREGGNESPSAHHVWWLKIPSFPTEGHPDNFATFPQHWTCWFTVLRICQSRWEQLSESLISLHGEDDGRGDTTQFQSRLHAHCSFGWKNSKNSWYLCVFMEITPTNWECCWVAHQIFFLKYFNETMGLWNLGVIHKELSDERWLAVRTAKCWTLQCLEGCPLFTLPFTAIMYFLHYFFAPRCVEVHEKVWL